MASGAAEILAKALEKEASAQEMGTLENMEAHIEDARRQVLPINDIPRPIFNLALRFWKEWARSASYDWRNVGPISEDDWPAIARPGQRRAQASATALARPEKLV